MGRGGRGVWCFVMSIRWEAVVWEEGQACVYCGVGVLRAQDLGGFFVAELGRAWLSTVSAFGEVAAHSWDYSRRRVSSGTFAHSQAQHSTPVATLSGKCTGGNCIQLEDAWHCAICTCLMQNRLYYALRNLHTRGEWHAERIHEFVCLCGNVE